MEGLNELEEAVIGKLLRGDHPTLAALRTQADRARAVSREFTGVGFWLDFEVPSDVPLLPASQLNLNLGDVYADVDGLLFRAGFILHVRGGRLDSLEGFTYDEPWPDTIEHFEVRYEHQPRRLEKLGGYTKGPRVSAERTYQRALRPLDWLRKKLRYPQA